MNENFVELSDSLALQPDQVDKVTTSRFTRVIIVGGLSNSGKTTLLTSFYQKFREGSFADYLFSWSETLRAFEGRLSDSLTKSDLTDPTTEHTRLRDTDKFLHLQVRRASLHTSARDLIFSDWPGEAFRTAKDSTADMKRLGLLSNADHIAWLVDCERLAIPAHRHVEAADADTFVRRGIDSGMINGESILDVVFAKWDVMERWQGLGTAKEYIQNFEENLQSKYQHRVGKLNFWSVAARPKPTSASTPETFQLPQLFESFVEDSLLGSSTPLLDTDAGIASREYDRYQAVSIA